MVTIEDILGRRNKQSMDRQELQQQVYNTPAVTPPAVETPPANALTLDEAEAEKNGSNGDVVQLGDQKPQQSPTQPASTPTTPLSTKPDEVPDFSKGTVDASATKPHTPGTQVTAAPKLNGVDTMPKSLKEWAVWNDEMKRRAGIKSDDELEKARRRDSVLAAIGDGISSLAQMYYANQGAIVNQNTGNTLSESVAKRHEQLRKDNDMKENQLLGWMRERRNEEQAKRNAEREDAYRREVLEQRAEQNRINAEFKKSEQERKAEELKIKKDKEERNKEYYAARKKRIELLNDDKEIENAVYYETLAKLLDPVSGDPNIPIEEAKATARAAQDAENRRREKEKHPGKGSSKGGRSRGRGGRGSQPRGNGYGGSGSRGTGYD